MNKMWLWQLKIFAFSSSFCVTLPRPACWINIAGFVWNWTAKVWEVFIISFINHDHTMVNENMWCGKRMVTFRNNYNSKVFLVLGIILRVTPHSFRCPLKCKNCSPADRKVTEGTSLLVRHRHRDQCNKSQADKHNRCFFTLVFVEILHGLQQWTYNCFSW